MTSPKTTSLLKVMQKTFTSIFYPQVALLFLIPMAVSVFFVIGVFWLTWDFWLNIFNEGLLFLNPWWQRALSYLPIYLEHLLNDLAPVTTFLFFLLLFALGLPLFVVLNLAVTSLLASTYLVGFIARKDFPALLKKGSPSILKSLWHTLNSCFWFLFFWMITLPLWLIPGVQIILPTLFMAWLNRRICLYDALVDYATPEELKIVRSQHTGQSFALGLITTLFNYLPFAIVFSPVLSLVAFIYFALPTLAHLREETP